MDAPIAPNLSELLEAVLPEDAPSGHEAWQKVKHDRQHTSQALCFFKFGPQRFHFQATLAACLTEEALLRVTRACYVKFSEGEPKERVKEFRDQIYARIRGIKTGCGLGGAAASLPPYKRPRTGTASGLPAAEGAGAAASDAAPPAGLPPGEASRPAPGPGGAGGPPAGAAAPEEDAPAGHEAWGRCHHEPSRGRVRLYLRSLRLPGGEEPGGRAPKFARVPRASWGLSLSARTSSPTSEQLEGALW
ncbi:unnamed protein product [Prorocentrum cordatum]|uniref:Uncharacterized protein n=1 Tax=Prorocentrum cordatum TaxID=2364126 RepID=A0ABN9QUM5_9DINO|nr:unnamed protein product [Polarella glacialis]